MAAPPLACGTLRTTYKIPYVGWTFLRHLQPTPRRNPWRCVLDPNGSLAWDRALDTVAADLGMDPYQYRMKNIMAKTDPDQDPPFRVWSDKGINDCLDKLYTESGYATKWHPPGTKTLADGRLHGIAITGRQDSHGGVSGGSRYGHIRMGGQQTDGSCMLYTGAASGSSGPHAAMMHIVAEVLGLKYTDVQLGEWANSDINQTTGGQNGSGHTGGAGSANYMAALEMRNRLLARACTLPTAPANFASIVPAGRTRATATVTVEGGGVTGITITNPGAGYPSAPVVSFSGGSGNNAAAVAQVTDGKVTAIIVTNPGMGYTSTPTVTVSGIVPNELDAKDSTVFLKSDPTKVLTHAQVVNGWEAQIVTCVGWGAFLRTRGVGAAKVGDPCNTTGSCASCVEVAVDPDTGEVEILNHWNAVETGTSIFKQGVMKELGSGCEVQLGQALSQGDIYDPNTAAILQMAHGAFQHPTTLDINPSVWHLYDIQNDDPAGPCGGRGIGEPCTGTPATIINAIFNATGKWVDWQHMNGGPHQVLRAIGKAT